MTTLLASPRPCAGPPYALVRPRPTGPLTDANVADRQGRALHFDHHGTPACWERQAAQSSPMPARRSWEHRRTRAGEPSPSSPEGASLPAVCTAQQQPGAGRAPPPDAVPKALQTGARPVPQRVHEAEGTDPWPQAHCSHRAPGTPIPPFHSSQGDTPKRQTGRQGPAATELHSTGERVLQPGHLSQPGSP